MTTPARDEADIGGEGCGVAEETTPVAIDLINHCFPPILPDSNPDALYRQAPLHLAPGARRLSDKALEDAGKVRLGLESDRQGNVDQGNVVADKHPLCVLDPAAQDVFVRAHPGGGTRQARPISASFHRKTGMATLARQIRL